MLFSKHISIPSTWKSSQMISFLVTLFYQTVSVLNHNLPNYISTKTDNGVFAAKMKGMRTALVKKQSKNLICPLHKVTVL